MTLREWNKLPSFMKCKEVRPYWEALQKKRFALAVKRIGDVLLAFILLFILALPMAVIALLIVLDSRGPVFFRQERVTAYGKIFRIHKFRTMVTDAEKKGPSITAGEDERITKIGRILRKLRLDELPQLFDVINGDMSFVGTRPESVKYVKQYKKEYYATLLMPAGITSEASIRYKDEQMIIGDAENVDETYLNVILPEKLKWNLKSIRAFSLIRDMGTMVRTVFAVLH